MGVSGISGESVADVYDVHVLTRCGFNNHINFHIEWVHQ